MLYIALLFFIGLIFLIILDLYLGKKNHNRSVKTHDFPKRHGEVELFIDGPSLFQSMFQDIKNAKHHIHMLFFIFRDDSFGQKMMEQLEQKASEGVHIRILLDWAGSLRFPRKRVKQLQEKGIQVSFCHTPRFPFFIYRLQSRNHRKITVIDGKVGYLGGFNVGKEYVNQDEKLNPWRDCHTRFTGEGVQDLQTQFLTDWSERTLETISDHPNFFPTLAKGTVQHQFRPYEGVRLESDFCRVIQNAKKRIIIGTPYFIPGKKVLAELIKAINRGVDLTIIVPQKSDHFMIKEASFRYLRKLLKIGCKVYQYRDGFYHAKVLVIDEKLCSIGTANFDKRSFYFNHEMNCFITDATIVHRMEKIAANDISKSSPLTLSVLNQFRITVAIKEALAFLFSPLL